MLTLTNTSLPTTRENVELVAKMMELNPRTIMQVVDVLMLDESLFPGIPELDKMHWLLFLMDKVNQYSGDVEWMWVQEAKFKNTEVAPAS